MKKYRRKISGPLLDRIDIQVHVRPVPLKDLSERKPAESSADIRARVIAARERQQARYAGTKTRCNADMQPAQLAEFCRPDAAGQALLDAAFKKLGMTARSYDRILRLARTIADLAGRCVMPCREREETKKSRTHDGCGAISTNAGSFCDLSI